MADIQMAQLPGASGVKEYPGKKAIRWLYKGDQTAEGLKEGRGVLQYKVGEDSEGTSILVTAEGEWKNDKMHGYGTLVVNGISIYAGNWVEGNVALRKSHDPESSEGGASAGDITTTIYTDEKVAIGEESGGNEAQLMFPCDLQAIDPSALESMWKLSSAILRAPYVEKDSTANIAYGSSSSSFTQSGSVTSFLYDCMNLQHGGRGGSLSDFLTLCAYWFTACLIIFLIFAA
jgi:hypothetical protein